ncbi:HEAT repeat domain-containing protein [Cyanobium sp. ATX 6F1]|uniref:HEAT repeat domain-containing protein n=1 Tax=unclassified Cyanobium TaxID=2627006 RepID=UPI0020CB884D|nr:HEAT repeat domain-containing protein [Cyanobium sp. ATX 6F1]MCP9917203.1 HEAT repeat domain-containing protein [Cyanobium sp. ATX 6F1]
MPLDDLFAQLHHPNPHQRDRLMHEIIASGDQSVKTRLLGLLDAEDVSLRRSAVRAMGAIGPSVEPLLREKLSETIDPTTSASCCKGMAQIAVAWPKHSFSEQTLTLLGQKCLEPNPVVQLTAVMALGEMGSLALPALERALNGDDLAVIMATLNALASMNHSKGKTLVTTFIANGKHQEDPLIQQAANQALERFTTQAWRA